MLKKSFLVPALIVFLLPLWTYANSQSQSTPSGKAPIPKSQPQSTPSGKAPKTPKPADVTNDSGFNSQTIFNTIVAATAIISILISLKALKNSQRASKLEHVFNLYNAWAGVRKIDPQNPIGPDVVQAANALNVTSNMWNNNVIEKRLIYENHWNDFDELYTTLVGCNNIPTGYSQKCSEYITPNVTEAYYKMKDFNYN